MSDAILIFTFSPVQPFIAEARRAADLFAGSQILVALARAAARPLAEYGELIYPAVSSEELTGVRDLPNRLVAQVPWEQVEVLAEQARRELLDAWSVETKDAYTFLAGIRPHPDDTWKEIWQRQTGWNPDTVNYADHSFSPVWECYWAAARLSGEDPSKAYRDAYIAAYRALAAVKRLRAFEQRLELGEKDTLSGQRSALHRHGEQARDYWRAVAYSPRVTGAKLRPNGRERLDAVGSVKRFGTTGQEQFRSVASVATDDYRAAAIKRAPEKLAKYREAIELLVPSHLLYQPHKADTAWPYDGDLFFLDTLTENRLEDSYNLSAPPEPARLEKARTALKELYEKVGWHPRPYYAVLIMDGDNMGQRIDEYLGAEDPAAAHRRFSASLLRFAKSIQSDVVEHHGSLIYAGGDDVLAFVPLTSAVALALHLQRCFHETVGATLSAGIALAHQMSPLDGVISAARQAEGLAKRAGKNALAVRTLKRSGEIMDAISPWAYVEQSFELFRQLLDAGILSSHFPHRVLADAYGIPVPGGQWRASLRRLLRRHEEKRGEMEIDQWAERLDEWAENLRGATAAYSHQTGTTLTPTEMLARWLLLARFIAQHGGEE